MVTFHVVLLEMFSLEEKKPPAQISEGGCSAGHSSKLQMLHLFLGAVDCGIIKAILLS